MNCIYKNQILYGEYKNHKDCITHRHFNFMNQSTMKKFYRQMYETFSTIANFKLDNDFYTNETGSFSLEEKPIENGRIMVFTKTNGEDVYTTEVVMHFNGTGFKPDKCKDEDKFVGFVPEGISFDDDKLNAMYYPKNKRINKLISDNIETLNTADTRYVIIKELRKDGNTMNESIKIYEDIINNLN